MMRAILLGLGWSVLIAVGASAQQPRPMGDSARGMGRQMMMQRMQAADARLDQLVSEMNRATGARKIPAMAAVINEMVAQRKQMRAHMMQQMEMMGEPRRTTADTMRKPGAPDDHAEHHDSVQP